MIFFRKYVLNRMLKSKLRNSEREKSFKSLKDIKSVLVLFDTKDFIEAEEFIEQLKKLKKKTTVCAFIGRGDMTHYSETNINFIREKDTKNWNDRMMLKTTSIANNDYFDMVVNFSLKPNIILEYILASVNSPFKTGFYKSDLKVHDFIISSASTSSDEIVPPDLRELGAQLLFYLKTIAPGE